MLEPRTIFRIACTILLLTVGLSFGPNLSPAAASAGDCVGTVFTDYNADGTRQTQGDPHPNGVDAYTDEPGQAGVSVTAYDDIGAQVGQTTTLADGTFDLSTSVALGTPIRVEFTWPGLGYLESGPNGPDNLSSVQFAEAGSCNLTFGVFNPSDYCGSDPRLVSTCFVFGEYDGAHTSVDTIVGSQWSQGSDSGTAPADFGEGTAIHNSVASETGSVLGLAWQRSTRTMFSAAFMKNHSGFGPGGPGAIYSTGIDPISGATTAASSVWLDVYSLAGVTACADPHSTDLNPVPDVLASVFEAVSRCSLGDIEISDDESTLYVTNLTPTGGGQILAIDIATKTLIGGSPWAVPVDQTDCPNPITDIYAGALGFHNGTLYAGLTCGAVSTGDPVDLRMYVYEVDTTGSFSLVLSEPIDGRDASIGIGWQAWVDDPADVIVWGSAIYLNGSDDWERYPQPWLTDINIVDDQMTLSIRDRMGDQGGWGTPGLGGSGGFDHIIAAGDALCAVEIAGTWTLESGNDCGPLTGAANPDQGGPGGSEFFEDSQDFPGHLENSFGMAAMIPGVDTVVHTSQNPQDLFGSTFNSAGGLMYNSLSDGSGKRAYVYYGQGTSGIQWNLPLFSKSGGMGDVETLCLPAPVEIGNFVWFDTDGDGVQDPSELPVVGATVNLYDASGALIASVVTNANGQYYFSSAGPNRVVDTGDDLFAPGDVVYVRMDNPSDFGAGGVLDGWSLTADSADLDDDADSDATEANGSGAASGVFPEIEVVVGDPGENDHTHDFGYLNGFDQALQKTFSSVDWAAGIAVFDITVTNQSAPIQTFTVTDYPQAGLVFDVTDNAAGSVVDSGDGESFDYTWNADGTVDVTPTNGTETFASGETITVPVALQIGAAWDGSDLVNWAEISNFDDNIDPSDGDAASGDLTDNDSTPDGDQANDDSAPDGPGEPGDDEINGDGDTNDADDDPVLDDEDDHDVAGVPVYDLELIKERSASQGYVIDVGAGTASFDITVTNQGNQDTYLVGVTDYLPAGTVYATFTPPTTSTLGSPVVVTDTGGTATTHTFGIDYLAAGDSVTFTVGLSITDFTLGAYVNGAEISTFDNNADPDDVPAGYVVDIDSTPDSDGTNDDVITDPANADDETNSHNMQDYDPDGDGNLNESTPGDEDDHDQEVLVIAYDLALAKTFDSVDWSSGLVTFMITVTNQGTPVQTVTIADYVDSAVWEPFAVADNPAGSIVDSGDGESFDYTWNADGTVDIVPMNGTEKFVFGESIQVPVILELLAGGTITAAEEAVNWAEISNFDNNTDPADGDAASGDIEDLDSTPDDDEDNDAAPSGPGDPGDDIIDGDGDGTDSVAGDEDDHDVAGIPLYDLALIKERSATQPFVVDPANPVVKFDITVKNQGLNDAYLIDVVEYVPAGMTFTSLVGVTAGTSGVADTGAVGADHTFQIDALTSGDEVTFTIEMKIIDLTLGSYINGAEISAFDNNSDPADTLSNYVNDIDSTPDADPTDDAFVDDGTVDPDDGDNNIDSLNTGEDDHDFEVVVLPFDLALQKVVNTIETVFPLAPGDPVTFDIVITNQGLPVQTVDVADYVSAPFIYDSADNPAGVIIDTGNADSFDYVWNVDGTVNIIPTGGTETFVYGETLTIPITLTINPEYSEGRLENWAEISNFDDNIDPSDGDAAGGDLADVDSTSDDDQANDAAPDGAGEPGDDVIDGNGDGTDPVTGDEDDHDVAAVPVLDTALTKVVDFDNSELPVTHGAHITFVIEVINQGSTFANNVAVYDYVDLTKWEAFDVALNPGTADYVWAAVGTDGEATLIDPLAPGDSIELSVTLEVAVGADLTQLWNIAEISAANASNEAGAQITNPDGSTVEDIDSTPDMINDDPQPSEPGALTDNIVDNTNGDEDDHDIAGVEPPTFSLGNQVWFDDNNDGQIDAGETPIEGVWVELFTDNDGDGLPDDTNGDGIITDADAVATTGTDADGLYLFTDLPAGDYIVGIPPMEWDIDGPLYGMLPSDPVGSDPNDDFDNDNNGAACECPDGYVYSGPVTLEGGEPTGENPDNDPETADSNENLTVDFGFWQPVFDTSLEKTLITAGPVEPGDTVTFELAITNEGTTNAFEPTIIDYTPQGLTLADSAWTLDAASNATTTLTGVTIPAGETYTITIDFTIDADASASLTNNAEIFAITPVDSLGAELTMPNGQLLPDTDSTPDNIDDGEGEDDYNTAEVNVEGTTTTTNSSETANPPPSLSFADRLAATGFSSRIPFVGALLLTAGISITLFRRREQD